MARKDCIRWYLSSDLSVYWTRETQTIDASLHAENSTFHSDRASPSNVSKLVMTSSESERFLQPVFLTCFLNKDTVPTAENRSQNQKRSELRISCVLSESDTRDTSVFRYNTMATDSSLHLRRFCCQLGGKERSKYFLHSKAAFLEAAWQTRACRASWTNVNLKESHKEMESLSNKIILGRM